MEQGNFLLRKGTQDDVDILVDHRLRMFEEINPNRDEYDPEFNNVTKEWITKKMSENNFVAFIAGSRDGRLAGSGCILIKEDQPRPARLNCYAPYLLSMFTEPGFRGQGVASLIIRESIKWAKENGYDRMDLHASAVGREIYHKFGFRQTNEMRLYL